MPDALFARGSALQLFVKRPHRLLLQRSAAGRKRARCALRDRCSLLSTRVSGALGTALFVVPGLCTNALHTIGTVHCTCYHRPKACLGRCIGDLCRGAAIRAGPEPIIEIRLIAGTKRRQLLLLDFVPHTACSKNPTRNCAAGERRRVVASQPPIATWLRCNDRGTCVQQVSSKWAVSRCAMSAGFWARVSFRGGGQGYGSGSG